MSSIVSAIAGAAAPLRQLKWIGVVSLIVAFFLILDAAPELAMWLAFALFVTTALTRLPKIVGGL